jgi:hypothetical protein
MIVQGLTQAEARAAWQPLIDFVAANQADYAGHDSFNAVIFPARWYWNTDIVKRTPGNVMLDTHAGATPDDFWWSGDGSQVGVFWHAFTSAWLPASLLQPANQARLVDAWFAATRHWVLEVGFNKGLAGASPAVLAAARDTAMNPDVLDAFALVIIGDFGPSPSSGAQPDLSNARARAAHVQAAMKALRAAAPDTGAYVNECDYFQPDWQRAFWGSHYPRLLRIKRRYDRTGLFTCHHSVGSEGWSDDGFTRVAQGKGEVVGAHSPREASSTPT